MEETVQILRSLWDLNSTGFSGTILLVGKASRWKPLPVRKLGPPIWIASWGSKFGLRRAARLGDGWLASAYNTTPVKFKENLALLLDQLKDAGKDPRNFANGLATHVGVRDGRCLSRRNDSQRVACPRPEPSD